METTSYSNIKSSKEGEKSIIGLEDNLDAPKDKSVDSNISSTQVKPNKKSKETTLEFGKSTSKTLKIKRAKDIISLKNKNIEETKNDDVIIEIDENKEPSQPQQKKKKIKKLKSRKSNKKNVQSINGFNPFTFFEKEKFKDISCKDIKPSDYVKQISLLWRNMTDEEKEPYKQMALEYKKNNLNLSQNTENKLINKKRKRNDIKNENDSFEDKKEEISNNSENENSSCSCVTNGKKGNENCINEYIYSVFVPFVECSYKFFMNKSIIKSK